MSSGMSAVSSITLSASTMEVWMRRSPAREAGAVVVRHPLNCGQEPPCKNGSGGLQQQSFEAIVTFDADGQHRPEDAARWLNFPLSAD